MKLYNYLYLLLSGTVIATSVLNGMQPSAQKPVVNRYKGTVITPQTIGELGPQLTGVELEKAQVFVAQNRPLLAALMSLPRSITRETQRGIMESNKLLLEQNKLTNKSIWNYAFELPETDHQYWVKVAGPINKLWNLVKQFEKQNGRMPKKLEADTEVSEVTSMLDIPTYQTPSTKAHYLLLEQAISDEDLRCIHVPVTYVLPTAPISTEGYTDNNCIIIQRAQDPTAVLLKDHPEKVKEISIASIREMLRAIIRACLWSAVSQDNLFINERGEFVVSDLEQPNISRPGDFFHKDRKQYECNIVDGISKFAKQFTKEGAEFETAFKFLQQFARDDADLATFADPRFKNGCEEIFKQVLAEAQSTPTQK